MKLIHRLKLIIEISLYGIVITALFFAILHHIFVSALVLSAFQGIFEYIFQAVLAFWVLKFTFNIADKAVKVAKKLRR